MGLTESNTQALVERAASGDCAALEDLLTSHRPRLRQMVCARIDPRVQGRVDPSDVIQEALATAAQGLPDYLEAQPIPFYPWLRRIAWQALLHQHERHLDAAKRTVRRERSLYLAASDQSTMQLARLFAPNDPSPSDLACKKELRRRVKMGLEQLPDLDREVLLQRYIEQLSIKEIAAVLDQSAAAIYKRHARALAKLRDFLEGSSP